jgi:hypothetical protein
MKELIKKIIINILKSFLKRFIQELWIWLNEHLQNREYYRITSMDSCFIFIMLAADIYISYRVYAEVLQHLHFCKSTTKLFQGRVEILEQIKSYILDDERNQPLVINGSPG